MSAHKDGRVSAIGGSQTWRRKRSKLPADYYNELRQNLPGQGPVTRPRAKNTEVNMNGVWKKWTRFCEHIHEDPVTLLKACVVKDYKTFFRWTLDHYPGIKMKSSLHEYFRLFKMLYERHAEQWMDGNTVKTVNSYLSGVLNNEYKLRASVGIKPVMSVDDLVRVLHHHWVLDTSTFADERQRVQLSMLLLIAAYTGQRPCSMLEAGRGRKADESTDLDYLDGDGDGDEADVDGEDAKVNDEEDCSEDEEYEHEDTADAEKLTRGILYKHIRMLLLRNPTPGERHLLVMEVTIVHTKGEDSKPQPKTFLFYENDNLLLCPVAHMLALALSDSAFEASTMQDVDQILRAQVPTHKSSLTLRWKDSMLNMPVLRQATRSTDGVRTSSDQPLTASASSRYLKRLGEATGFEHPLRHYAVRRGAGNAVDSVASVAERDQIMGHAYSGVFQFYLNQRVKCDVQAAFLGRPSEKALLKAVGHMSLTADARAPTKLTEKHKIAMATNPTVSKLRRKRDSIASELKTEEVSCAENAKLIQKKRQADAALQCAKSRLRVRALAKLRKDYFRNNDTEQLEAQFIGQVAVNVKEDAADTSITYQLKERARLAKIICQPTDELRKPKDVRHRRIVIQSLTALCEQREARRRSMLPSIVEQEEVPGFQRFPMKCERTQCIFCLGLENLPFHQRVFQWSRRAKMMDHVDKDHLQPRAKNATIDCPHPMCKEHGVVLQGLQHFKSHVEREHGIRLRA